MPEVRDFLNGWWRDSSFLIVHHDSHFVYWFDWFKYISMHVWMLPMFFFWFSLIIQLNYLRILVFGYAWVHFSFGWLDKHIYIASLLSPTYAIGRYASERMVPTAEQILGARGLRILRPQTSQYVGCRPYCWSSPRSLMTMAALVRHIRFFQAAIVFSLRTVGYGGWSWWQKTTWTTAPNFRLL